MRRVLLLLLFLMLIPWADIHAQPFAPTGSVRTCTDCDTTACTAQQMIAIEPVPGTGQGLPYICDTSTGFFVPWPGGAGGGAPISASYLTLGLNGVLTAERVFTCDPAGSLSCADTGANGTYTPILNVAHANVWTATQTYNIPSVTEAIIIDHAASASPGVSDGNPIVMTGRSDDGTPHRLDWRFFVDAETNAGQSSLHFQQRNDAGSFTQKFAIGSLGLAVIGPKIGAGAQEVLRLWTDPTTPAVNDGPRIVFHAEDSFSNDQQYGQLQVLASDVTDGSEDGSLSVNLTRASTITSVFTLTSLGNMVFGSAVDETRDLTFNRGATDGTIRYDGSLFDFINGGITGNDVTVGTVDEARLDANVVLDNEANSYTGGGLQDFGAGSVKLPITDTALAAQGRVRVASTGTGSYYYDTAQRQHAITGSDIANSQAGSCTFAAGVSCAVTLPVTEADASYLVMVSCSDSRIFWADTKATTGFTINASASTSGVCDWRLVR